MFSKIYYTYHLYICIQGFFFTMLDKGLRENIKKKEMEKLENIN